MLSRPRCRLPWWEPRATVEEFATWSGVSNRIPEPSPLYRLRKRLVARALFEHLRVAGRVKSDREALFARVPQR